MDYKTGKKLEDIECSLTSILVNTKWSSDTLSKEDKGKIFRIVQDVCMDLREIISEELQ